jgi:cytochrome b561
LLALVLLHIGAALYHHFVRRDDVLRAMWPWRSR